MFSSMKKAAVAVATVGALALAGASGAQANWSSFHVGSEANRLNQSGSMAIDATAGQSRLVVNGSVKLECNITFGTGQINTGLYTNGPTVTIGQIVPQFDDCTGPLGLAFDVTCTNPPGGGTTNLSLTNIPTPFAGTASGEITNIYCVVRFVLTGCTAVVTGSVNGSYTNPATPSTPAELTVFSAGQSLTVSGSGCPTIVPNGTAQYGAPVGSGTGLTNIDYEVTGPIADQPYLTPTS